MTRTMEVVSRGLLAIALAACEGAVAAETDKRGSGAAVAPPGNNLALPSAVSHSVLPSGIHKYVVRGLDFRDRVGRSNATLEWIFREEIPNCLEVAFHVANNSVSIGTSQEIDLPRTIDRLSRGGRIVPTWRELCIRDTRSDAFNPKLYELVYEKAIDFPHTVSGDLRLSEPGFLKVAGQGKSRVNFLLYSWTIENGRTFLVEYSLRYNDNTYVLETLGERIPVAWDEIKKERHKTPEIAALRYATRRAGTVRFNKAGWHCQCCPQYAMRVFDDQENFIWEDVSNVFGRYYPVVVDFQGDGVDEIVVYREEHHDASILVYRAVPEVPLPKGGERATKGERKDYEEGSGP